MESINRFINRMNIGQRRAAVLASVAAFPIAILAFGPLAHADEALPRVTIEDATALEGDLITFVARLDKRNSTRQLLTFSWKTRGVTATPGQDFTDTEYTASFWPGADMTEIHIPTTRDDLDEGSETFELVASDPWGLVLGNTTATGTIQDPQKEVDSNVPAVSVLPGPDITEGEAAAFTLVASPRSATPLRVSVTIGETGRFAASGQTGRRTITIPPGRQATFTVRTANDGRNESPGSVDVSVNPGSDYRVTEIGRYSSASVAVADNDLPVISIDGGSAVREGRAASFVLSASPRPAAPIDVRVAVTQKGEFASPGQLGERTVTVGANGRGTFSVATDSDTQDEDDGFVSASLVAGQAYAVGAPDSARVDVSDGGAPTPRISVRATTSAIVEGGTARFELTASPRPAGSLGVSVEITDSGNFARQGETGTRTVTIGPDGRATIDVETDNDLVSETDGSLTARVLGGAGYLVTSPGRASVEVRDESVQVRIGSAGDIVEGGTATFTLTAEPPPPESLAVNVNVTERGGFLTGGAYTETVTVGADGRGTFSVDTINDEKAEDDGAIVATVEGGYGYAPGSPAQATARVSDSTPTVTIAAGPAVIEGDTATFALTARPAPQHNLTVRLQVTEDAGGSFVPPGDLGYRDATIYADDGTGTLEIFTESDETDEAGGTLTAVILADEDGYYRIGSPRSATLRVNDDDHGSDALAVSLGDAEVAEGQEDETGRKRLAFPVTLSKPANHWVTVYFELRPREEEGGAVPATPDVDYRATGYLVGRWVRFSPGETEAFTHVDIYDDDEYEPDPETFELIISDVRGAEIADGRAIGAILPDPLDAPRGTPVVTISAEGAVGEGQGAIFKLRAAPAPAEDLVVDVRVFDDSYGTPASDYLAASDEGLRQVTIPGIPNRRVADHYGDSLAALILYTVDDDEEEGGGKIVVQVEAPGDGRYDASQEPYSAEVGVRDNDGPPPTVIPAFSIADAEAYESDGSIRFDVTLDHPVPPGAGPMTVQYRPLSWEGGAQPGVDFEYSHGTLTFYEGETWREIEIKLIEDQHDEGTEVFRIYLSNASGGARIADYLADGRITNSDPMPAAWSARFGRAVAQQAIDGIAGRLDAPRESGVQGGIGGFAFRSAGGPAGTGAARVDDPAARGAVPATGAVPHGAVPQHRAMAGAMSAGRVMSLGDLLAGSRFAWTGGEGERGGSLAFWGQGSRSWFSGAEDALGVEGDVTTALLGADYARQDWLVGVALLQSRGRGGYGSGGYVGGGFREGYGGAGLAGGGVAGRSGADMADLGDLGGVADMADGGVDASLTAAVPYASWRASERLKLWTAAGYGTGGITLQPGGGEAIDTGLGWTMAAGGLRGDLFALGGASLSLVSDALWARTTSDRATGLAATDAGVSRLRLGIEASRSFNLPGRGGRLTPKLELGARRDGGDAETGFGVEVGGGVAWSAPGLGLTLDIAGRALLSHEDGAMRDRGFSASLAYDPRPDTARGLSLALRQDIGGRADGGLNALFASDPLRQGARGFGADAGRWTMEAGYGLAAIGDRFTGTPHVGYGASALGREVSVGWRLAPEAVPGAPGAPDLSLGVLATRGERDRMRADHGVGVEFRARW